VFWRKKLFCPESVPKLGDLTVPIRKVRSRRRPAWLSPEIMAAIRRKQRLCRSAKKGKNVEDYEAADKEVKRLTRNAKRNFEKRLACQN
jgi:hypothetical protein